MQENKPKLLQLITNFGQGGAQRAFYDHAVFLSQRYNVSEAVFDASEFPNLYPSGNSVHSLEVKGGNGIIDKIKNFRLRPKRLKQLVDEEGFAVCISHMDGANWVNVLSRSKAKKILFVQGTVLHNYGMKPWLHLLTKKFIIPFLYNKASVTVAVSEGIKYELEHYCKVKNVVSIPNFFDVASIEQKALLPLPPAEEQLFNDYQVLVNSGRFHEQKKQRFLFPVLKKLHQKNADLKLVLLGDGELRHDLITEAKGMGFRCYSIWEGTEFSSAYDIYFLGYRENPFQYLHRSTLFVFPSGWEGFPLALCEAMISGVPILSSDCPTGPREILAPDSFDVHYRLIVTETTQYGILLPMTDKDSFTTEWVKAIENLLPQEEQRMLMIVKAKERVKAFDKSVAMQKWFSVIEDVMKS